MNKLDIEEIREILQAMEGIEKHISSGSASAKMEQWICAETEFELALETYKRVKARICKLIPGGVH